MRAWVLGTTVAGAVAALLGCSAHSAAPDYKVGDCVKLPGSADRAEVTKAPCGSRASNFKVVAIAKDCPADADSSYVVHNAASGADDTLCLDIDWVVGGCMRVDPAHKTDPWRVDCNDASVPNRQRVTQILTDLDPPVGVDQCASGQGYAYTQRRFAVCVENVGG